jgi:Holliday junction resolvase RusA-like endonuclease
MSVIAGLRSVSFTVVGRPQQKGSKTSRWAHRPGGGVNVWQVDVNEKALKPWAAAVSAQAAAAFGSDELIRGPVEVRLTFCFARPKSHYGSGRNALRVKESAPQEMITTPDIDKLARAALDALTGVVIADDSQVVSLILRKRYGTPERMIVALTELTA